MTDAMLAELQFIATVFAGLAFIIVLLLGALVTVERLVKGWRR